MSSSENARPESMALAVANNYLAVHLHRLLAEENQNVFFSPFSISTAMSMLYCAAGGETAAEMKNALGYEHSGIAKVDLAPAVQELMTALLKSDECYTLTSANSMLFQKDFFVKEDYKLVLTESFKALLLEEDFQTDSEHVVKKINDWVKEQTRNMIPTVIDSLDPNSIMILINAVYFKGSWLQKFNEKSTQPGKFFNKGKKGKSVDMMKMKGYFPYTDKNSYQALQLPYLGEDIAMLILLPRSKHGLEALEASLTSSFVENLSNSMPIIKVKVTLPRFRLEYSKSLVEIFQRLGVKRLFCSGADLSGASDSKALAVSDIFHKSVLEVNEEGSEAAAVTMIRIAKGGSMKVPKATVFSVDHPFAFAIYNSKSNLILFMGRVEEL